MRGTSQSGPVIAPALRRRSDCVFRKCSPSMFAAQPPAAQCARKKPRTCVEGPFGELLRGTGPMVKANPFRFSTKYQLFRTPAACARSGCVCRAAVNVVGARVICLHLPRHETMVLFYAYTKAQRENLSPEQLKRLRQAVGVIKQEFKP
jgi:hypothetical protein